MFFKNAIIYKIQGECPALTDEQLSSNAFTPCGAQDLNKCGWTPAYQTSDLLVQQIDVAQVICLTREEKILPPSVIREKLAIKVTEIEKQQDRKVYNKEKETLKEELIFDLAPKAFTKRTRTCAYIDSASNLLVVDTNNYTRAEELIKLLRESLGSLPVLPLMVSESPTAVMTAWLRGEELPESFELSDWTKLAEAQEGGARAQLDHQELTATEVNAILDSGKQVTALELDFDEAVTFRLNSDLRFSRLRFSQNLIDEAQDRADGDKHLLFSANILLMSNCLRQLYKEIVTVFGEKEPAQ